MRIDAHQHFWRYAPATHAWIDERMTVLKRDFVPDDLAPLLAEAGFDACVAVQATTTVAETGWLLELADRHPFIRGVVGWVDLTAADAQVELDRLRQHPRLRGIRHVVQAEPDGFLERADFLRGVAALAPRGLAYDLLLTARQLPEAIAFVDRFPEQRFVLDHIAKPEIAAGRREPWARDLRELSRRPHVCCKLSGLVTEADWQRWTPDDLRPYLEATLAAFGPRRLMIGSDWPVCLLAASHGAALRAVTEFVSGLSQGEQDDILGGTAARWYEIA